MHIIVLHRDAAQISSSQITGARRVADVKLDEEVSDFDVLKSRCARRRAIEIAVGRAVFYALRAAGRLVRRADESIRLRSEDPQILNDEVRHVDGDQRRGIARHVASVRGESDAGAICCDPGQDVALTTAAIGADCDGLARVDVLRPATEGAARRGTAQL